MVYHRKKLILQHLLDINETGAERPRRQDKESEIKRETGNIRIVMTTMW